MDKLSRNDRAFLITLGTYLANYSKWTNNVEAEKASFQPIKMWEYSFEFAESLVLHFEECVKESKFKYP